MPFILSANIIHQPYIKSLVANTNKLEIKESYNISQTLAESNTDFTLTHYNTTPKDAAKYEYIKNIIIKNLFLSVDIGIFKIITLSCILSDFKINQTTSGLNFNLNKLLGDIK